MKNLNAIILVLLSVVLFSCNKDEDSANFPTETIKIEDDLKINFADLKVVTIEGEAKVDAGGNFNANTTNTVAKNLPLLFIKDNEIMFGYYSKTGLNNSISTTDLLLFYFTLHPEIALQGFQNSELLDKIKQNSNYSELTSLIKSSLNANIAPLKNASFVNLLNKTGQTIGVAKRQAKTRKISKTQVDAFKYIYSRDGTIVWDKKFPLFATVGMEVVDVATGVSVSGPQIFDSSGVVLSPNSAVVWLWDNLTAGKSDNIGMYKLPKDGKYEVRFTNGVDNFGTAALEEKVDFNNRFSIGINLLSIAIPIGIKDFLGATECKTALSEVIKNMKLTGITFVATDQISMAKFVTNLSENIFAVSVECVKPPQKAYLKLLYAAVNYLNKVEETSTLYLLLRDYLFSDIKGKETRNYYDGVSFGELQLTNTTGLQYLTPTGTEFSGQAKSEHTYTTIINETTFKYSINRSLLAQSTITIDPASKEYAIGLPFEVNKTNAGDATLKGNSKILTNNEGKLAATFVMGTQETKFEIKPAFKNSGLSAEFVNLKDDVLALLRSKVWVLTNTPYYSLEGYYSNPNICPDLVPFYKLESGSLVFTLLPNGQTSVSETLNGKQRKYSAPGSSCSQPETQLNGSWSANVTNTNDGLVVGIYNGFPNVCCTIKPLIYASAKIVNINSNQLTLSIERGNYTKNLIFNGQ